MKMTALLFLSTKVKTVIYIDGADQAESTPTVMSKKKAMFMSCAVGKIYVHIHVASCAVRRRKSWHYDRVTDSNVILMFAATEIQMAQSSSAKRLEVPTEFSLA